VSNLVLNNKLLFLLNDEFHDMVNNNNQNNNANCTDDVNSGNVDEPKNENRTSTFIYDEMLRK